MTLKQRRFPWLSKVADIPLFAGLLFAIVVIAFPEWLSIVHGESPPRFLFPIMLLAILACAFRASAHTESIAHRLREPFGTLVLTLSAVTIEVALVVGIMLAGHSEAQVARDTMFAVIMMIMNGLVGFALVLGGLRKREQTFNAKSATAFLALITALALIGLVMPRLTVSRPGGYMSEQMEFYVAGASLGVYVAFLALQSSSHREFFVAHDANSPDHDAKAHAKSQANPRLAMAKSVALLVLALVVVVMLAEVLGDLLVDFLERRFLPRALEGVIVAFLILLPEGITAARAAWRSNLQTTINILHGSALSTIGLTVPAVLLVSLLIGSPVELGLEPAQIGLLAGTIVISMLHLSVGRANLMQGIVHLMFFTMWIALILD